MKLCCQNGCTIDGKPYYKTREFERQPDETHCPECGDGRLLTGMERNARKKASQRNGRLRNQSDAESRAAEEFHERVAPSGEACWAKTARHGHVCRGRIEAHHILPLDWWRKAFGDLPEDELLALMYAPVIGAPLCGGFHVAVTPGVGGRKDFIYFNELDRELIEHCERLDLEYPNRGVLARLEFECPFAPEQEAAHA